MEGITNHTFRALMAARGGIDVVCTEFVRISGQSPSQRWLRRQVVSTPAAALSVQVMGNDLENMAQAAETVARAGADVVDLNVGCPAPNAVRKGVGSALLKDKDLLFRVIKAMRLCTPGLLSAKMRAGYDTFTGAVELAQVIESAGVDFLVVHPRRRIDQFQHRADWRIIKDIKASVNIPVVGNGDIWSAADAERMRIETGCDAVMIGRGALANPWIFRQMQAWADNQPPPLPCGDDVLQHIEALIHALREAFPRGWMGMAKDHLRYLCRAVADDGALAKRALRAQTEAELRSVLVERLSGLPSEALRLSPENDPRQGPTDQALCC